MNLAPKWLVFADAPLLQQALAKRLEQEIVLALAKRGHAFLALAGGSTPLPTYKLLSTAQLDWSKVSIVPTDERWVARQHAANNLQQLQQCFCSQPEIQWLSLSPIDISGQASAGHAVKVLASMPMAFDVVLLGMGLDAHTASLFPFADGLDAAMDPNGLGNAIAITPVPLPPEAPFSRVSLSLTRLLHARSLLIAITGVPKREVLERALDEQPATKPIAHLLQTADTHVEIYWSP